MFILALWKMYFDSITDLVYVIGVSFMSFLNVSFSWIFKFKRFIFFLRGGCDFGPKDSKQICNYVYSVLKKIIIFWHRGNGEIIIIFWFCDYVIIVFYSPSSSPCFLHGGYQKWHNCATIRHEVSCDWWKSVYGLCEDTPLPITTRPQSEL